MAYKLSLTSSFIVLLLVSCNTSKLKTVASVDSDLKELSGIEIIPNSELLWSIEDSGNPNTLYGLNTDGQIIKNITISNAKNRDWEDITCDKKGNLYIGDFGNNSKKYKRFHIYKVSYLQNKETNAETVTFELPKDMKSKNFEAFFLWENSFYLFSKESKKIALLKVPNRIGKHTAKLISTFRLEGKNNQITASDISEDGKKVVLLSRDRIMLFSDFETDNFFDGKIDYLNFEHDSQKEGVCFKNNNTLFITDESNHLEGGNIYEFNLFQEQ